MRSLAISGSNIFAGTYDGVYLSTNNGTNWTQTALNNGSILTLATSGSNIFAGTYGFGVYLSTNNGTSWTQTEVNNQYVLSLAISGSNIFAGTNGSGVYFSTNNGTNWTQTALNNRRIYSLSISGSNIFAGTYGYGVYLSTNNGTSWNEWNFGFPAIGPGIIVSALLNVANGYLYAAITGNSVWRRPLLQTGITAISPEVPESFALQQNYPNPFNPKTIINYQLRITNLVKLTVYDVLGHEVAVLVNEKQAPGTYQVEFDGSGLSSGVYFYKIVTEGFTDVKRMMLLK
ncbi:MAG: T9SS type A sorting domain-containing protein [Ignavibacteria bacterium]|nr:T9SS type A sorting domain-containing protein [Ignavibacteria bacterium]